MTKAPYEVDVPVGRCIRTQNGKAINVVMLPAPNNAWHVICYSCRAYWWCGNREIADDTFEHHGFKLCSWLGRTVPTVPVQ